jgi:hypothetical protein
MHFQLGKPRSRPVLVNVLAGALAAAGIVVTAAGCAAHVTPLGPDAAPSPRHLGSPIVLRAVLRQPFTAAGGCPAGFTALSLPAPETSGCSRPLGAPVTLTSAAIAAPVAAAAPANGQPGPAPQGQPAQGQPAPGQPAPGQPAPGQSAQGQPGQPAQGQPGQPPPGQPGAQSAPGDYPITVAVPTADVAAVTAVIAQAYDSHGAIAISVAGKTWAAAPVDQAFPGRQFQIMLPTMSTSAQLQRILVPSG